MFSLPQAVLCAEGGIELIVQGVERVTSDDVQRVATDLFKNDSLAATVLGNVNGFELPRTRLGLE